jgi:uncharacterized protein (TIGR02145 family)
MKNKSLLMTMAILLVMMSSMAQPAKKSQEPEVKKDENKTSGLLDFSAFEGHDFSADFEVKENSETETFTDSRDGKIYKTIIIGNQIWMAENLAYKATEGCWANNNDSAIVNTYGYLYNWDAANSACPAGWHLPSDVEWQELINFSGGNDIAGGKLKETGNSHWSDFNKEATNQNGFTALPGGSLDNNNGEVRVVGEVGFWWSSAEDAFGFAFGVRMDSNGTEASIDVYDMTDGISVRCMKDK